MNVYLILFLIIITILLLFIYSSLVVAKWADEIIDNSKIIK